MNKKTLLEETIADADAIKAAVEANAKQVLAEYFSKDVKEIVKQSIDEELEDEEEVIDDEETETEDDEEMTTESEDEMEDEMEDEEDGEPIADDEEIELGSEDEEDEEIDLESLVKEIEDEMNTEEDEEEIELDPENELNFDNEEDEEGEFELEGNEEEFDLEDDDEEIDLEIEDDEEEFEAEEDEEDLDVESLRYENKQLKKALNVLREALQESKLMNLKLDYIKKLEPVIGSQNVLSKISETFDKAKTAEQVKLTYYVLKEQLRIDDKETKAKRKLDEAVKTRKKKVVKENVEPKNEMNATAMRLKKLAGIQ